METNEELIRDEAREFFKYTIQIGSLNVTGRIQEIITELKNRLLNFYLDEYKVIFLNELLSYVPKEVNKFKSRFPTNTDFNGLDLPIRKLIFYIEHELQNLPKIAEIKSTSNFARKRVFVSYCHADKAMVEELKRHFKPFKTIDFWEDSRIMPGQKWKKEIEDALEETKVAILLISADFFASDFITNNELPPLLEAANNDGCTILTVILRPVAFEAYPHINQYQAMNNPSQPVSKLTEEEREELWVNVFRQAKRALEA